MANKNNPKPKLTEKPKVQEAPSDIPDTNTPPAAEAKKEDPVINKEKVKLPSPEPGTTGVFYKNNLPIEGTIVKVNQNKTFDIIETETGRKIHGVKLK